MEPADGRPSRADHRQAAASGSVPASGDRARELWTDLAKLAIAWAVVAVAIAISRGPAAETHHRVDETSDVYVLPPPTMVEAMSLGHRAAFADYLWAGVLVEQGLHTQEKRRFENMPYLIDTINALDPTFRDPYLLIEALTVFQVNGVSEPDIRRAREIVERGARNLPNDPEILGAAGSFIGLMAPSSYLSDPAEKEQWTVDGAAYLARAAELGDDKKLIGWQALGGYNLLRKTGRHREAVAFLEHALAGTDDEELRQRIKSTLEKLAKTDVALEKGEQRKAMAAFRKRQDRFDEIWRTTYPLASRTGALVMGPPYDPAYCAGGRHREDERCALDWAGWAARLAAAQPGN
jgi:tetratricopeptide (TPR) repeat protein